VKRLSWSMLILAALVAAGIGGYRIGQYDRLPPSIDVGAVKRADSNSAVIYYRDPDGKPFYSAEPKMTPDGRPWHVVHADEDISFDTEGTTKPTAAAAASESGKILYYRNPMGLPDISKVPKKDPMGMDYIPIYEGEADDGATVKVSAGKLQRIGVKTEAAARRVIAEPVRAPGSMQLDERRIVVISLRAESLSNRSRT
jgi:Cu(I)/Ag(I) efflux system membrane fusion protein